ncbi:MAG: ATP-binding protein [Firmicutes bacterium]|nr:ATP-binding protein [Bacillota bacterium]
MDNHLQFNWSADVLLEQLTDGFIALDLDWRIRYANPACETFLGLRSIALSGKSFWEMVPESVEPLFRQNVERALQCGAAVSFRAKVGHGTWWHTHLYMFSGGLAILLHDVSQHDHIKELIDENYNHFAFLIDAAQQVTSSIVHAGQFGRFIGTLAEQLGFDVAVTRIFHEETGHLRLMDAHGLTAIAEDDTFTWVPLGAQVAGVVAKERTEHIAEHMLVSTPDPLTHLHALGLQSLICEPLLAHGQLIGTVAFGSRTKPTLTGEQIYLVRMIAEQIARSLDRAQLNAALAAREREAAAHLESIARQEAQFATEMMRLDKLNLVGEMAAGIGHEVRNPLTTVRGLLQLMEQRADDRSKAHYRIMISEIDRANAIITEYLSLAKQSIFNPKHQNINELIESLYPLVQADATIGNKQVQLSLSPVPDLLLDSGQIRQMLLNFLRNGLEAMSEGGTVTIGTYAEGDHVRLLIQDSGGGIPDHVMEKLGTPFVTTKENGTGLGLAVCYAIARNHYATIHLDTGAGGTSIHVRFPIAT